MTRLASGRLVLASAIVLLLAAQLSLLVVQRAHVRTLERQVGRQSSELSALRRDMSQRLEDVKGYAMTLSKRIFEEAEAREQAITGLTDALVIVVEDLRDSISDAGSGPMYQYLDCTVESSVVSDVGLDCSGYGY